MQKIKLLVLSENVTNHASFSSEAVEIKVVAADTLLKIFLQAWIHPDPSSKTQHKAPIHKGILSLQRHTW